MGRVFFLSTIPCKCERLLNIWDLDI